MVYQNKIVAAIKVAGKVLRENQNSVTLPFGCEYSILIKNLDSRRVTVKVSVDGKDATEGTWLVIPANSDIELERFIRNSNFESGNRFKFIERTGEIEGHRGIGAEDGLIRIEYKRELVVREEETIIRRKVVDEYSPLFPPCPYPRPWPPVRMRGMSASGSVTRKMSMPTRARRSAPGMDSARRPDSFVPEATVSMDCAFDPGITVAGSESNQKFVPAEWFRTEEQSEVIVLKLRGKVGELPVEQPVTVDLKPQCSTCGKVNPGMAAFCQQCGTALRLI